MYLQIYLFYYMDIFFDEENIYNYIIFLQRNISSWATHLNI